MSAKSSAYVLTTVNRGPALPRDPEPGSWHSYSEQSETSLMRALLFGRELQRDSLTHFSSIITRRNASVPYTSKLAFYETPPLPHLHILFLPVELHSGHLANGCIPVCRHCSSNPGSC